jgi:hypothetical protein
MENAPKPTPTNIEIINSTKICIDVQGEVLNNETKQGEKRLANTVKSKIAEMLDVFTRNGLEAPQSIILKSIDDSRGSGKIERIRHIVKGNRFVETTEERYPKKNSLSYMGDEFGGEANEILTKELTNPQDIICLGILACEKYADFVQTAEQKKNPQNK